MTLSDTGRLEAILQKLLEAEPGGIRLWELLEWDTANHGVTLQDSHRNLEDLSGLQPFISMGGPYYLRMAPLGKPIFEPTVRVTERGREHLISTGLA